MATILITGAAGKIAAALRPHLAARHGIVLRLVDKAAGNDLELHHADLTEAGSAWTSLLEGADAVIHLAANASPDANWPELTGPNIDATLNLYRAAAARKVPHVILASSIWAAAGRCADTAAIDAACQDPGGNPYGASKLIAERIAQGFWRSDGIATTVLRIGAFTTAPASDGLRAGWDAEARLSPRDLCGAVDCALRIPPDGVRTLNLISHNIGARFTLDEARETIGFVPQDHFATPKRSLRAGLRGLFKLR